jgi:hypothetical protein
MSLPHRIIYSVRERSEQMLEERLKENSRLISIKASELKKVEADLQSMEEKYIGNRIEFDTYQRWYTQFSTQRIQLQSQVATSAKR